VVEVNDRTDAAEDPAIDEFDDDIVGGYCLVTTTKRTHGERTIRGKTSSPNSVSGNG
jgi:hypothetical protein